MDTRHWTWTLFSEDPHKELKEGTPCSRFGFRESRCGPRWRKVGTISRTLSRSPGTAFGHLDVDEADAVEGQDCRGTGQRLAKVFIIQTRAS